MKLRMTKFKAYITDPKNIIAFIIFVFWLGMVWANTNNRLTILEQKQEEFNVIEIQTQLAEINKNIAWIQKDIEWLKMNK